MATEGCSLAAVYEAIKVAKVANSLLSQYFGAKATRLVPSHRILEAPSIVRQANRHILQPIVAEIELCSQNSLLENLAMLLVKVVVHDSLSLEHFSLVDIELNLLLDVLKIAFLEGLIEDGLTVFHNGVIRV